MALFVEPLTACLISELALGSFPSISGREGTSRDSAVSSKFAGTTAQPGVVVEGLTPDAGVFVASEDCGCANSFSGD